MELVYDSATPLLDTHCAQLLSRVQLFVTLWTVVCQAPLSTGFFKQRCWSRQHFLLQEIFLTQGLNQSFASPALQADSLPLSHQGGTPGCITRKNENSNLKRYRQPNGLSSTTSDSHDMEATQVPSTDEWIKKMCYTHTHTHVYIHTYIYLYVCVLWNTIQP